MATQILVLVFGFLFAVVAGASAYLAFAEAKARRGQSQNQQTAAVMWTLVAVVALLHMGFNMWLAVAGITTLTHFGSAAAVNIIAGIVVCAALASLARKAARRTPTGRE